MTFTYSRSYRGPLKAVVFDWAGTIVDYGSVAPVAAMVNVFERDGVALSRDEARGPMGRAKRDHILALLELPAVAQRFTQRHGRSPGEADVERLYDGYLATQADTLLEYGAVIPGAVETAAYCRAEGIRVGSSTGYVTELVDLARESARQQGLEVETVVCASDVSPGRPAPWLIYENARRLGVYPMEAIVKIDDTVVGIEAGLNAGTWTVGIVRSGNLVGLTESEIAALPAAERATREQRARTTLEQSGAHFCIDSVAELPSVLEAVNAALGRGERP